jgi:predicted nucleic acid-binding protein
MAVAANGVKRLSWILERQRLANSEDLLEKKVFDLNILAVFLVKGHPGFKSVSKVVEEGLRGAYIPLIMDFLPMRAYWIMTQRWSLPSNECAASIEHFLKTYDTPRYPSLSRETILEGFRFAKDLKHDVFDCMYLAIALQEKATGIVTTDTDFEKLCNQVGLKYINPVPREVLKQFKEQNK